MGSSTTDLLASYLVDTTDAVGVVDFVRANFIKSLPTYLSATKKQWLTLGVHNEAYPAQYAETLQRLDNMIRSATGVDKAALTAAKTKLVEFNTKSLTDKNGIQRRVRTTPYSGHALVDDMIVSLQILPPYMNDLKVTVAESNDQKKKQTQALERKSVQSHTVQASEMIAKCRGVLKDTRANPFDLAVAIGLITGRRMIEIFKTGTFTAVGEDCRMRFGGQVKKSDYAEATSYDIPVLAPPELVKKAVARLRSLKDCSELTKREGNLKWSNSCNTAARRLLGEGRHFHDLRALYAVIAFNAALPHRFSLNAFIAKVLGHEHLSNSISYSAIHIEGLQRKHKFVWREAM
jgi:Telomere resolvase